MSKLLNFLLGFVAGGVVSSAIVTLFAPSSGIELQDHVKGYVQNVGDEVRKARETRRQELHHELDDLRRPTR
jgi:gas vesicle protein